MESFMDFWPVISGLIAVAAIGVAFRAEITVRVKVLEDKVKTLFDIINRMK
jgi:hypothetical protein